MKVTRRYRFCASHRLDVPQLSAEDNRRLYGKCNNPYGHGHDYVLDVTVDGPVDDAGLVVDRSKLDSWVTASVLQRIDHKNLSREVEGLKDSVATTENLAKLIAESLRRDWPLTAKLRRVRIMETDRNIFVLDMA